MQDVCLRWGATVARQVFAAKPKGDVEAKRGRSSFLGSQKGTQLFSNELRPLIAEVTYRYAGRDYRLTDVEGYVVKDVLAR